MEEAQKPLPVSKHIRVYFEVVRTFGTVVQVTTGVLVALKVFHVI